MTNDARQSGAGPIRDRIAPHLKCRCTIGSIAAAYRAEPNSARAIDLRATAHFISAGRTFILSSKACDGMRPPTGDVPMTARLTNRLANFCASLLLALLILSVASAARADSDDGIVRVKSAVPMAEAITRIKADIAGKGIKFFIGDRPVEACGRRRHQAAALDAAGVRQSAARDPVHHLEPECRARLAGAAAADAGRQWRCLGGVDRFRTGSRSATTSGIAPRSSRWRPRWSASITSTITTK